VRHFQGVQKKMYKYHQISYWSSKEGIQIELEIRYHQQRVGDNTSVRDELTQENE
jgi:hypothetical protein